MDIVKNSSYQKVNKLVYGVGINDADYAVQIKEHLGFIDGKQKQRLIWSCPFYEKWKSMLERAYSPRFKFEFSTYKEVFTCPEWHLFSNFKAWMEQQDWEGKCLDKDILIRGNKIYSPETCCFVESKVNTFIMECNGGRSGYLLGVTYYKPTSKFKASCRNPFTGKTEHLGYFQKELDAHRAWLTRKRALAIMLSEDIKDDRIAKALIDRYSCEVY